MSEKNKAQQQTEKQEQIPLPLIFTRSSLFVAFRGDTVPAFDKKELFVSGPWRVSYTGFMLRQQELDLWSTCLRLCRRQGLAAGERLVISRSGLLKAMGVKNPGGDAIENLITRLERLRSAMLTVEGPVSVVRANLLAVFIEENAEDVSTRDRIILAFDPLFQPLLEDHVAENSVSTSLLLRQALAKWLYRYTTTCSGEFRVGLEKLRQWSGNAEDLEFYDQRAKKLEKKNAMPMKEFRRNLLKAVAEIKKTAPDEFAVLELDEEANQLVIRLSETPKVLIKRQEASEGKMGQGPKGNKPIPDERKGWHRSGVAL